MRIPFSKEKNAIYQLFYYFVVFFFCFIFAFATRQLKSILRKFQWILQKTSSCRQIDTHIHSHYINKQQQQQRKKKKQQKLNMFKWFHVMFAHCFTCDSLLIISKRVLVIELQISWNLNFCLHTLNVENQTHGCVR